MRTSGRLHVVNLGKGVGLGRTVELLAVAALLSQWYFALRALQSEYSEYADINLDAGSNFAYNFLIVWPGLLLALVAVAVALSVLIPPRWAGQSKVLLATAVVQAGFVLWWHAQADVYFLSQPDLRTWLWLALCADAVALVFAPLAIRLAPAGGKAHQSAPAGWYPDGSGRQRYWDGRSWTDHFA
jgi:hypothetical protein